MNEVIASPIASGYRATAGSRLNPEATKTRYAGHTNNVYRAGPNSEYDTRE
jgi:hypothetical protein